MPETPDPDAVHAAAKTTDPGRLLPGEDPDTEFIDDAQHWAAVYTELLSFKARILDVTLQQMENAKRDEVRLELQNDQTALLAEIERFQHRLRFWHDREIEMSGQLR